MWVIKVCCKRSNGSWWSLEYAINGNSTNPLEPQIKDPVYNINFHIVTRTDAGGHLPTVRWP